MIGPVRQTIWRNDISAAQTLSISTVLLAALGTMLFTVALGGLLMVFGSFLQDIELFWLRYLGGFGFLFFISPLLSWYGLIFGGATFLVAANKGYAGWLSILILGIASSTLLYVPFFSNDIHPVFLIVFGGMTALVFWLVVKVISKGGLIPPRQH